LKITKRTLINAYNKIETRQDNIKILKEFEIVKEKPWIVFSTFLKHNIHVDKDPIEGSNEPFWNIEGSNDLLITLEFRCKLYTIWTISFHLEISSEIQALL
jgi:hypothetical protein